MYRFLFSLSPSLFVLCACRQGLCANLNRIHINKSIRDSFVWVSLLVIACNAACCFFFPNNFCWHVVTIFVYIVFEQHWNERVRLFPIFHVFRLNLFGILFFLFCSVITVCYVWALAWNARCLSTVSSQNTFADARITNENETQVPHYWETVCFVYR